MKEANLLKKVQRLEVMILEDIDRVCKKNGIEYFLIGGTALGAVRHRGFIPWDDDIDLGMTREHYDKFLRVAQQDLAPELFLQTPATDPYSPYAYAKVRLSGTKFLEWWNRNSRMHPGVYVDVFPYDNIPDDSKGRVAQFRAVSRYSRMYTWRQTPYQARAPRNVSDYIRQVCRYGAHLVLRLLPRRLILVLLDKQLKKYSGSAVLAKACLFFPVMLKEYMEYETLYPLAGAEFEGRCYPVPGNVDKYLRTHYGDYMVLPPEDQRRGHLPYVLEIGERG